MNVWGRSCRFPAGAAAVVLHAPVTVELPSASRVGVNVSVPSGAIAGWTAKSPPLVLETVKVTFWEDSSAGPAVMPVAQPGMVCAPRRETTD